MLDLTKVSVIVPVYNVEKYLRECMDSLINQTFEDIELICINDGSTDNSLEILKEYSSTDDRIKIIDSKTNQGLSKARNVGLDNVAGKYIYFMDSDDILRHQSLERLYDLAESKSLDLIIFKLINFDDGTQNYYTTQYYEMDILKEQVENNVFSHSDLNPEDIYKIAVSAPGKFYKTSLIKDLRFPEGLLFEDNPFFVEAFFKAERVLFLDEYLYERRVRNESITTTVSNKNYMDYLIISEMLIDITKKYGLYEKYREGLYFKILTNIYLRFSQINDEFKDEYFKRIKEYFLTKKEEFDNDEVFQNSDERLKEIFYSGIESQNAREFELSIKCIDLDNIITRLETAIERRDMKIERRDSKISKLKSQQALLINNSQRLSDKVNSLSYNNKILKNENENYKEENENLQFVNSQIMQSNSWKLTKPIRLVGSKVKK